MGLGLVGLGLVGLGLVGYSRISDVDLGRGIYAPITNYRECHQ